MSNDSLSASPTGEGHFYSRARSRAAGRGGTGKAEGEREARTERDTASSTNIRAGRSGASGYGARASRDEMSEAGGDRDPVSRRHEATGYGYGYGPGGAGEGGYALERGYESPMSSPRERGYPDRPYRVPEREVRSFTPRESTGREGRRSRWQREPLVAGEIMTKNPRSVRADSSIQDVARIMRDENTGVVPVVDEQNHLQGLVTDRDIVMRSIPEGKDPFTMRVGDLMTEDIEAATADEPLRDVVRVMGDKQVRRIPVVDQNDKLVGIISMADVATRADYDQDLQDALEEISSRRSFWSRLFS
jgi:CBS domain-containing protein